MRLLESAAAWTRTDTASIARAVSGPSRLLMPSVRRAAVVKSGVLRFRTTYGSVVKFVATAQRRHQQAAAAQAARVADRIDGDVNRLTGLRECRQVGTHGDCRNVLQ